ncbi:trypsin-like peptidase domain-containing protein [Sulfuricurvum sp.]|uniref:S1C family serine protease n=1 Tax=Sulfuricurvum sp. TaxID=2025608 RepID=UPI0026193549|nr:trypsin-like peptidase domain-containing protein [Sulfuricurvum sp.]MDD2267223.1 trypsin-like peptidase domain-containing protein [Sulfuricurvum sp.]MDD2785184.1 trypsin-like peptidase domain-containing protein [Sulfuricurvum sp.]
MLPIRLFLFTLILTYSLSAMEPLFSISAQVKKVLPSIVKIKVQKNGLSSDENELISTDAGGSGFVLDSDHHLVTNTHVIGEGKKIAIIDQKNVEYIANLIAKDDKTDIAVLEAPAFNAPELIDGNTTALSAGDGVFVIGSPYSLDHSVSLGIISAIERFLPNYPYIHFIQTDAAVNPGNSGGAIFDLKGELVGMTSTYFSRQGGYTNIAFAIPIEEVRRIAHHLLNEKKIVRGYLGAELLISERLSRKMGYQASTFVTKIDNNSPADNAGLQSGDLIVAVDSENFKDSGDLHRILEHSHPGETITLTYVRDKQLKMATIILGIPSDEQKELNNLGMGDASEKLGLLVQEGNEGIEVITTFATAKITGLRAKDIILQFNTIPIKTIDVLNSHLSRLKDTEIAFFTIKRENTIITLPIGQKTALKGYLSKN